jgi:hypothetical protein
MQSTADFHNQVTDTRLPEAAGVVHDATALDAAVDGLEAHAPTGDASIRGFLRPRESPASRLLVGIMISTSSSVNARKPRACSHRPPASKGYGVAAAIR